MMKKLKAIHIYILEPKASLISEKLTKVILKFWLVLWESHTMCCNHIQPPTPPLPRPTLFLPCKLCVLFFLPQQGQFVLPKCSSMCCLPLEHGSEEYFKASFQSASILLWGPPKQKFISGDHDNKLSSGPPPPCLSVQYIITGEAERRQVHYASERYSFGIKLLYFSKYIY